MSIEVINKCQRGEEITWSEYVQGASRTLSDVWHGDKYPVNLALGIIHNFIAAGKELDRLKKALYYGKHIDTIVQEHITFLASVLDVNKNALNDAMIDENAEWSLDATGRIALHAALGLCTESVEVLELIKESITYNSPLDTAKMSMECGDVMWYFAVFFTLGFPEFSDLNPILRNNLLKLYQRFGDKFTFERALNRDEVSEEEVLQRGYI